MNDSKYKIMRHIETVRNYLNTVIKELTVRQEQHDQLKLEPPEVDYFVKFTPKLKGVSYGSDTYVKHMKEMKPAIEHHYSMNSHHPENVFYRTQLEPEEWKPIKNFEGYYEVSNWGRIKTLGRIVMRSNGRTISIKEKILKAHKTPKGYFRVQISANGKYKNLGIHRAVAMSFIPNPNNRDQVNHKNCNKTDNYYKNLEWANNSENQIHAYRNGLQKIKYVIHCEELNLTTFGVGEMTRQLKKRGYNKARASNILSQKYEDNYYSTHLGLHFTGFLIEEYEPKSPSLLSYMNFIDLIELICDWKAASLRHEDDSLQKSINMNQERFGYSDELKKILLNTAEFIDKSNTKHKALES